MKGQIDEFTLVLMGGLILIGILVIVWSSQASTQLVVTPESKKLTIARGSFSSFPIFLNGSAKNVTLRSYGEIASWISFDKQNFDVDKEEKVTVYVNVPATASYGMHWGDIYVETLGFQKKISLSVNVSTRTEEKKRTIDLGDFTVGYIIGEETIQERSDLKVEKGYFSEFSPSFAAILSEEKLPMVVGGYIQIVVDQTNGLGNLIVEFNDNITFDKKVGVGEVLIPISKDLIKKSNSIILKASDPGFVFWSSSIYSIASVKFVVEYNGTIFREFNFSLEESEVMNFKEGKLSFFISKYDVGIPQKLGTLIIKINNEIIYEDVPPSYFVKRFREEVKLKEGINTISFSTEKGVSYLLEDVTLTLTQY
jgi:hypothetical protein